MTYRLGRRIGLSACMAAWRRISSAVAVTALMAATAGFATAVAQEPAHPAQQDQGTAQSGARFKSAVDLVSVVAVVRDRKGRFVPDLSQRDFIVGESGQNR